MNMRGAIWCNLLLASPALACVEIPIARLSDEAYELLREELSSEYPELMHELTIRSVAAFGYEKPDFVYVELSPHRHEDGVDVYYEFTCSHTQAGERNCRTPEEKREIVVQNPEDAIQLYGSIDANTAVRIVDSIRREIVVDEQYHFVFLKDGYEQISSDPLDLSAIWVDEDGRLLASAPAIGTCASHEIEVQEIDCGLDACDFKVVENAVRYQP